MSILNKILGIVLCLLLGTYCVAQETAAISADSKTSILVISERVEQANSRYLIYPEVSEMIAAEVINKLNTDGAIYAPTLSSVREKLRGPELSYSANKLLNDYRYTYELNYQALRKIAKSFNTTNVLIVTGGLDTVSDFIKPTWWSFLNVPGENVVKTEYRLYTYLALVDLNSETIKWQNTYHRQITSPEFALANATFSPDYRQLNKIKKGSIAIAKDAAYRVENVLAPWYTKNATPPTVHELVKNKVNKKYNEYVQNINDYRTQKTLEKQNAENFSDGNIKKDEPEKEFIKLQQKSVEEEIKLEEPKLIQQNAVQIEDSVVNEKQEKNIQVSPLNIIIPKM